MIVRVISGHSSKQQKARHQYILTRTLRTWFREIGNHPRSRFSTAPSLHDKFCAALGLLLSVGGQTAYDDGNFPGPRFRRAGSSPSALHLLLFTHRHFLSLNMMICCSIPFSSPREPQGSFAHISNPDKINGIRYSASRETPNRSAEPRVHCQLRPIKKRFGTTVIPLRST
jgi:hypothetical protein